MARFDNVAGFVLTGGASARMGSDKALLEIDGAPLALRVARLLEPLVHSVTLVGPARRYARLGLPALDDDAPGQGPLGGIATVLRASDCDWNLVVGCDLPYLGAAWLEFLITTAQASAADALIPHNAEGLAEPLCAMYHRRCLPAVRAHLAAGVRKVTSGLAGLRVDALPHAQWKAFDSHGRLFKNMNSPEDYAEAKKELEQSS